MSVVSCIDLSIRLGLPRDIPVRTLCRVYLRNKNMNISKFDLILIVEQVLEKETPPPPFHV